MVKLDVSLFRFLEDEDFRVLTALEMTMRNHDLAPTVLVERIADLSHGGCRKRLSFLLKNKIIFHENTVYDGYAMTYQAYDFLAFRTLNKRGVITSVGHRIGCGKESDIILVQNNNINNNNNNNSYDYDGDNNNSNNNNNKMECVLKLQRLGRCSFRNVSRQRDYKGNNKKRRGASWFYLSRLASQKEYLFLKVLYDEGFPVPRPIEQNRHALLMEFIDGRLLNNISELLDPQRVYCRCAELIISLAEHGLIHGDFNEFNLIILDSNNNNNKKEEVIMIDFPQMISTNHPNAEEYFNRDVQNIALFFKRRFQVETFYFPELKEIKKKKNLDTLVYASGCFSRENESELERLMKENLTFSQTNDSDEDNNDNNQVIDDDEKNEDENSEHTDPAHQAEESERIKIKNEEENKIKNKEKKKLNGEQDDDTDDSEGEGSLEDEMRGAREERRTAVPNHHANANFLPDGNINETFIKKQIRKNIQRKDDGDFNRRLNRNMQKGRQKQKINRQLKSAAGTGFFD